MLGAQQGEVVSPGRFAERPHVERHVHAGKLVANERAHMRPVGIVLFRREHSGDFGVERRRELALLAIDKFLQLGVRSNESGNVDFEIATELVDHSRRDELQRGAVAGIGGRADRRGREMVEQASRRVFLVGKERAIEQRGFEYRNLKPGEESSQ